MRTISNRCKYCCKTISTKENWFNGFSQDTFQSLKTIAHLFKYHHKEVLSDVPNIWRILAKQLIKYIPLQIIDIVVGILFGAIKIICFPFWWVYENM